MDWNKIKNNRYKSWKNQNDKKSTYKKYIIERKGYRLDRPVTHNSRNLHHKPREYNTNWKLENDRKWKPNKNDLKQQFQTKEWYYHG